MLLFSCYVVIFALCCYFRFLWFVYLCDPSCLLFQSPRPAIKLCREFGRNFVSWDTGFIVASKVPFVRALMKTVQVIETCLTHDVVTEIWSNMSWPRDMTSGKHVLVTIGTIVRVLITIDTIAHACYVHDRDIFLHVFAAMSMFIMVKHVHSMFVMVGSNGSLHNFPK